MLQKRFDDTHVEQQHGLLVAAKFLKDSRRKEQRFLLEKAFLQWARIAATSLDQRALAAEIKAQCLEDFTMREAGLRDALRNHVREKMEMLVHSSCSGAAGGRPDSSSFSSSGIVLRKMAFFGWKMTAAEGIALRAKAAAGELVWSFLL